ncbi:hypothetical protein PR048_001028 [Dryococelus australis]|uniref:Uncharacterized protein n=1 Tax=Dryococelus australis TaxID=614101 RepID=A0ABQ9IGB3_9NEOP|nr:hypothetical protein PR048_001028 [Dryococelus australis]
MQAKVNRWKPKSVNKSCSAYLTLSYLASPPRQTVQRQASHGPTMSAYGVHTNRVLCTLRRKWEKCLKRVLLLCSIGLAIANRLATDGAKVVVSSRKESNVQNAVNKLKAAGLSVSGVVCHVGKAEDRLRLLQEAVNKFGGIDILVSNAGVNPAVGPVLEVCGKLGLVGAIVLLHPGEYFTQRMATCAGDRFTLHSNPELQQRSGELGPWLSLSSATSGRHTILQAVCVSNLSISDGPLRAEPDVLFLPSRRSFMDERLLVHVRAISPIRGTVLLFWPTQRREEFGGCAATEWRTGEKIRASRKKSWTMALCATLPISCEQSSERVLVALLQQQTLSS